jgi:hypothetical protein
MYEIDNTQFSHIHPLLHNISAYLSLPAIITGKSRGRIWVDNPLDPGSALVWDLVNGFLFVFKGVSDNSEINLFLKDILLPLAKKSGYPKIYTIILSELTNPQLNELFKGISFNTGTIDHFQLNSTVNLTITVPPTFHLVKIDGEILEKNITNMNEIKRCITACWPDLHDYFEKGIGYVLLTGNTAVSWCSTDYVVSSACDLYVETFNCYKQKGFATAVSLACIKECLNQGYEVNWHCWHDNKGSIRLAKKIGFLKKGTQKVQIITLS